LLIFRERKDQAVFKVEIENCLIPPISPILREHLFFINLSTIEKHSLEE